MEGRGWRVEGDRGGWREVEGRGWRVEGGGWRVEGGGKWRVEGGGWRVEGSACSPFLGPLTCHYYSVPDTGRKKTSPPRTLEPLFLFGNFD